MAADVPRDLAEKVEARTISYGAALSLRFLMEQDRRIVCAFLEELRPSSSLMKEFAELILDISKREGLSAAEIIAGLKDIMTVRQSRKIKTEKVRRALRARRFPSLTEKEKELKAASLALSLPANVSLHYPENMEGKKVSLTIRFENMAELQQSLDEIKKKADRLNEFLEIL